MFHRFLLPLLGLAAVVPLTAISPNPQQFSLHLIDPNRNDYATVLAADPSGDLYVVSRAETPLNFPDADSAWKIRVTKTDSEHWRIIREGATTVNATIGGVSAPVYFSGLTPTLAGLYQVNVRVPVGVTPGNEVQMTITATDAVSGASAQSNSVTIAVQ